MYNETIKVANKIITDKDLEEIFGKMCEEMQMCEKQNRLEIEQNERFERDYQNWTMKDYSGKFTVDVKFYDDTRITFDKYYNFMGIFNSRLDEIKNFYLNYSCSYIKKQPGQQEKYISQHISMEVYEEKMSIEVKLNSDDKIMNQVFDTIKSKVISAPEKYDKIVKNKSAICNRVGFACGFIPASIILFALVFIKIIREIYAATYVGFPIVCIIFALMIGNTVFGGRLEKLYKNIMPEKKYAGYDTTNMKSIYKDDIDKYIETSEIIIGKNVNNLNNREEISKIEKKYSGFIKYEILALLVMSILVVVIGKFI